MATEELRSYGELEALTPAVVERVPTVEALAERLRSYSGQVPPRRVTVRAAGNSLDAQALGADVVLLLVPPSGSDLTRVVVHDEPGMGVPRVEAGALASWSEVLRETTAKGWVVPVVPTGRDITVGGTVSVDSVSRFSPAWGKQYEHLLSVEVLLPDGRRLTAKPVQEGGTPEQVQLFRAVVCGLGLVGVVLSATFRLRRVPALVSTPNASSLYAWTKMTKLGTDSETWADLVERVLTRSKLAHDARLQLGDAAYLRELPETIIDGVSSVGFFVANLSAKPRVESVLYESRLTRAKGARPSAPYGPPNDARVWAELQLANPLTQELFERVFWDTLGPGPYVDPFELFTFFMEGDVRARAKAAAEGNRLLAHQQTFYLPEEHALSFLENLHQTLVEKPRLVATLFDLLWIPRSTSASVPFLCASPTGDSLAVTVAWQRRERGPTGRREMEEARALLQEISLECLGLGGRVSLTKTVATETEVLRGMYGHDWTLFKLAKEHFDPRGLMRSKLSLRLGL